MDGENSFDFFEDSEFGTESTIGGVGVNPASPHDIFSILEALDGVSGFNLETVPVNEVGLLVSQKSNASSVVQESETEIEVSRKCKKQKVIATASTEAAVDGQQRISHLTVERNRRKQMNEHLIVLRSLTPSFYVKRADQASIIGGVADYITELQQVLKSLEAKKQRKAYTEVLSPRLVSSPRPSPLSPRKPPLSPILNLPLSPRTPQPYSPYKTWLHSPTNSSNSSINDSVNELVANSKSEIADVEVKFSCPNVLLKTVSPKIQGQTAKIISALEELSLEILHVNVSTVGDRMRNSFTIKIGIECQLSAEDLALQIQQTFC
ncbi:transcription factor SPEECHLESS-like [Olea europaea subsp. europaea]|uniref:Transcription factor SPEECHLESS-like n=1 Tax=Olea europaea subsp. europaea TaxID=158383 RepID=A0A8S0SZ36_OLEEU|nr:transcription factor SPEECHLESS-like [Olea europaea subsp. europaea]